MSDCTEKPSDSQQSADNPKAIVKQIFPDAICREIGTDYVLFLGTGSLYAPHIKAASGKHAWFLASQWICHYSLHGSRDHE